MKKLWRLLRNETRYYIRHEDVTTKDCILYFGPFPFHKIQHRLNDAFADWLAEDGPVICVPMTDREANEIYVNPPEYWMKQLKKHEDWNADA